VSVNMLKKGRARIVKYKATGEPEEIGWVSTHSDTGDHQLVPNDDYYHLVK